MKFDYLERLLNKKYNPKKNPETQYKIKFAFIKLPVRV